MNKITVHFQDKFGPSSFIKYMMQTLIYLKEEVRIVETYTTIIAYLPSEN